MPLVPFYGMNEWLLLDQKFLSPINVIFITALWGKKKKSFSSRSIPQQLSATYPSIQKHVKTTSFKPPKFMTLNKYKTFNKQLKWANFAAHYITEVYHITNVDHKFVFTFPVVETNNKKKKNTKANGNLPLQVTIVYTRKLWDTYLRWTHWRLFLTEQLWFNFLHKNLLYMKIILATRKFVKTPITYI